VFINVNVGTTECNYRNIWTGVPETEVDLKEDRQFATLSSHKCGSGPLPLRPHAQ
jgi:hypothetical protein